MNMEYILIFCMAYGVIGASIGILEAGGPAYAKCGMCRDRPALYIVELIFLWPMIYIIWGLIYKTEKTVKCFLLFIAFACLQKFVMSFAVEYVGLIFGALAALVLSMLVAPVLFGILRMPGFIRDKY